eukprot:scaffold4009_cov124-Cylindrotheca_fusiformis.AAC.4
MNVVKKLVASKRCVEDRFRQHGKRTELSYRPPKLITSTVFDNDDIFSAVANALIFKYETEGLSERDSINATIFTATEREAFLESLDLRNANIYLNHDEELMDMAPVDELVRKTRSIFGKELQSMWRENKLSLDASSAKQEEEPKDSSQSIPTPLKTPKNLRLSPVQTSQQSSNTFSTKSSGLQRRRSFFPDACDQARCKTRIRIDFKFQGAVGNAQPVKSLQLDGISNPQPLQQYIPPSSPLHATSIRVVSPVAN